MTAPSFATSQLLEADGVSHGFFSRAGGVSKGALRPLIPVLVRATLPKMLPKTGVAALKPLA